MTQQLNLDMDTLDKIKGCIPSDLLTDSEYIKSYHE